MDSFRFRPQVVGLEDRLTPATPAEAANAAAAVTAFWPSMVWLAEHQNTLTVFRHRDVLATALPNVFQGSMAAANIINEFKTEARILFASNPGLASQFGPYIDQLGVAAGQAFAMAGLAWKMGHDYGAPDSAFIPTPPPPPTPPPVDETDAGMSDTVPDVTAEGWTTRDNGLRVRDAVEGTGEAVVPGGNIRVQYTGWLTDGTVFDSSRPSLSPRGDDAEPLDTPLSGVIQGWQEGVPGMKPGGIRQLYIPAALGYGAGGSGNIPPNADLIFEIKLISTSPLTES